MKKNHDLKQTQTHWINLNLIMNSFHTHTHAQINRINRNHNLLRMCVDRSIDDLIKDNNNFLLCYPFIHLFIYSFIHSHQSIDESIDWSIFFVVVVVVENCSQQSSLSSARLIITKPGIIIIISIGSFYWALSISLHKDIENFDENCLRMPTTTSGIKLIYLFI